MYLIKTPWWLKLLYPKLIWNKSSAEKNIYITFDDGPIPEITPWVLNLLDDFGAKATFFCIGDNIEKHSEIFYDIKKRGHTIGNHTFNHLKGWEVADKDYLENFTKCQNLTGTELFRPPYGKIKRSQINVLKKKFAGIKIIMWDILSGDFDQNLSPQKCLDKILKKTRNGSIVVFHDSLKAQKNLYYVLPLALAHWQKKGYTFKAL